MRRLTRQIREWWFLRQCRKVERMLAIKRADAEIAVLNAGCAKA